MTRGAFGRSQRRAAKLAYLAESSQEPESLIRARYLRQEYIKFFKTEDGRKFVRTFGKTIPIKGNEKTRYLERWEYEHDVDFGDPATLSRASIIDHPIEHIEPQRKSAELDGIDHETIALATATFESAMRWCMDGIGLVQKGSRSAIVIAAMRPDLRNGLELDLELEILFLSATSGLNGAMALSGKMYGRVLEWLRRGDRISELGERIMILFYVLRPDLIEGSTLAQLGAISNKTRQAKDKLTNCLRDTYDGLKARTMRADVTRARCRIAQLAAA
jgi:hypothetical protein